MTYYRNRDQFGGPTRRRRLWPLLLVAALILGAAWLLTPPAHASETAPAWSACPNLKAWSPNEDEQDRRPTPSADGLVFENDQLVHHAVAMDLKDVHPGGYSATPAPSLDDFFSIEVYSTADPHGYATLRYEATGPHAGTWDIGGTSLYSPVNPTGMELQEFAAGNGRSTNVISFGVGYVAHPATGVKTTVSSVTFHGVTYPLTCKPAPESSSASPKPSGSGSPKPSGSHSTSASHGAGAVAGQTGGSSGSGALAITGPNGWVLGGGGLVLLVLGVALVAARRRKTRFTA